MSIADVCGNFVWSLGDWLIHDRYGIGRYVGTNKLTANNVEYECVGIEYGPGKTVWTPTSMLSEIGYYADSNKELKTGAKLTKKLEQIKIDARKWVETFLAQARVREATKVQPMEIIPPEHPHPSLTIDQQNCIEDIASDLASGKLMDRLVCGDVCTGKTEVAIQAIRIALHNKGQVVVLAPTTVLAQQHFNTISRRLSNHNIQLATRASMSTDQAANAILQDCIDGKIDVLVATHSVVRNSKWAWKNLQLVIVDEEHCFGSEDKERAKFVDTHYLCMTATPLPKTSHMVINCGKKISTLKTLPNARTIAATHIVEEIDIADLVKPHGQVLCICRRIADIPRIKQLVRTQLNARSIDAPIFVAHGRMEMSEIERILQKAANTPGAILISTALVGVGIDKESMHTLVVFDANNWSLSQLHQLRGRVSRCLEQGAAYFLSPIANRPYRLRLLKTYSQPGSGWILAQKDMELRGAGSLVGTQQSGHASDLGVDVMLRLVREAEGLAVVVDIPQFRYLIPESYVDSAEDRVSWYRKLSHISSETELRRVREQVEHQYGPPPQTMRGFWHFYRLKVQACKLGIKLIKTCGKDKIAIKTYDSDQTYTFSKVCTLDDLEIALQHLESSLKQQSVVNAR